MARGPQRNYSLSALECWLNRLAVDWEVHFSAEELKPGRDWYRAGEVRALDLTPESAVATFSKTLEQAHAVVEWEGEALAVRASINPPERGRALAVALLYEVEELIADELSVTVPASASREAPLATPARVQIPQPRKEAAKPPGARTLDVHILAAPEGVRLLASWDEAGRAPAKAGNGGSKAPLDGRFSAFETRKLARCEREQLLRLTNFARRAGFQPRNRQKDYLLRDFERLSSFVRDDLPRWKASFACAVDPQLKLLRQGPRQVALKARVAPGEGPSFRIDWACELQGRPLDAEQAAALLKHPGRILFSPEQGLLKLSRTAREVLDQWRPSPGQDGVAAEWPLYQILALRSQRAVSVEVSGAVEDWEAALARAGSVPVEGLLPQLRDYQRSGVRWLHEVTQLGAHPLLADDMGLGKTLQVLNLLTLGGTELAEPSLVVCPASVVPVWLAEAEKFFPGLQLAVLGAEQTFASVSEPRLWVSSYSQLRRHREALGDHPFAFAVLDEAQMIRNPEAKTSQTCWAIRARHRLALTGTPVENRLQDLWSLFRFLMPGLLGTRRRYQEAVDPEAAERLERETRARVAPFVLRRTKQEVLAELPPRWESVLACPLSPAQRQAYAQLVEERREGLDQALSDAVRTEPLGILTLLLRLRQAACDPALLPGHNEPVSESGKLQSLVQQLEAVVQAGQKAVVFSQFVRFLNRARAAIEERFDDLPIHELTGKTVQRASPVKAFQKASGPAVFLASLKAGGTGITLNTASCVFLLDPWWNPAAEAQAIDRVHRMGQKDPVMIYRLIAHGTVEERVEALKLEKRQLFSRLTEGWTAQEDNAQAAATLRDFIALT